MAHKGRDRYLKISKDSVFYNALVLSSSGVALQILGFVYRIYLSRLAGAEGLGVYRLVLPVFSPVTVKEFPIFSSLLVLDRQNSLLPCFVL